MLGTFIRFVPVDIVDLRPGGGGGETCLSQQGATKTSSRLSFLPPGICFLAHLSAHPIPESSLYPDMKSGLSERQGPFRLFGSLVDSQRSKKTNAPSSFALAVSRQEGAGLGPESGEL